MRKARKCESAKLYTGVSKCPPDFRKMKAAILVKPGHKLPADLTEEKLEELIHADRAERAYGIVGLCEYAKNGGEVQTAVTGWGAEQVTGVSARKDAFDLEKFYPELDSSLMKTANSAWDAYFIDEDNFLHGINDGTDVLAGYPMSSVYGESTPMATSSARATMQVVFCHEDARRSKENFDYEPLGFMLNIKRTVLGILGVKLEQDEKDATSYRLLEAVGGNDITSIYGPLIAEAGADVLSGATTAATYNEDSDTLTITGTGEVRLKSPAVLYEKGIKGIEQV